MRTLRDVGLLPRVLPAPMSDPVLPLDLFRLLLLLLAPCAVYPWFSQQMDEPHDSPLPVPLSPVPWTGPDEVGTVRVCGSLR